MTGIKVAKLDSDTKPAAHAREMQVHIKQALQRTAGKKHAVAWVLAALPAEVALCQPTVDARTNEKHKTQQAHQSSNVGHTSPGASLTGHTMDKGLAWSS